MLQIEVSPLFNARAGCHLEPVFAYHTKAVDDYLKYLAPKWAGVPVTEASGVSATFEANTQLWTPGFVLSRGPLCPSLEHEYVQQYVYLLNKPVRRPRAAVDKESSHLELYLQDSLAEALSQVAPATESAPEQLQPIAAGISNSEVSSGTHREQAARVEVQADMGNERSRKTAQPLTEAVFGKATTLPSALGLPGSSEAAHWDADLSTQKLLKPLAVPTKVNEHRPFFSCMLYGFLLSLVMLPVIWVFEQVVAPLLQAYTSQYSTVLLAPLLIGATVQPLHECMARLLGLGRVLHFPNRVAEQRFLYWFGTSRMFLDVISHTFWFVAGACIWLRVKRFHRDSNDPILSSPVAIASLAGMVTPLLPAALVLFSRWELYAWKREALLIFSRTAFSMALLYAHCMAPEYLRQHMTIPFVALAQLITTASMQIRLSAFIPTQLVYLLVVIVIMGDCHTLMHTVQLFGFGFCLPAMLLYSLELYSRQAFLAVLIKETATYKCNPGAESPQQIAQTSTKAGNQLMSGH